MEKIQVTLFKADCGRTYRHGSSCKKHEKVCKCFSNPKFRSCHTCDFNGGFEKEDGERYRICKNENYDFDKMKPYLIPNTKTFDCVNCPLHSFSGNPELWVGYPAKVNEPIKNTDNLPF